MIILTLLMGSGLRGCAKKRETVPNTSLCLLKLITSYSGTAASHGKWHLTISR